MPRSKAFPRTLVPSPQAATSADGLGALTRPGFSPSDLEGRTLRSPRKSERLEVASGPGRDEGPGAGAVAMETRRRREGAGVSPGPTGTQLLAALVQFASLDTFQKCFYIQYFVNFL